MDYYGMEPRPADVWFRRLRGLALLAGFSGAFMWLTMKLGTLCPAVLEYFAITSIF